MKIFLFLFILFSSFCLIGSICLDDLFCYICPYTKYDQNYEKNLKSSINLQEDLKDSDCILKESSQIINRKIMILNKVLCNECENENFDNIYQTIAEAFVNESRIAIKCLYSNISFYLQEGDHFIRNEDFFTGSIELFRRTLAQIKLMPFLQKTVRVYFKTKHFFIFISSFAIFENIDFYGNDLNYNGNEPCFLSQNETCCPEANLRTTDASDPCLIIRREASLNNANTNNGFLNIEYIFDNIDNTVFPKLIINNCNFFNFVILDNKEGFGALIVLTTFSGIVQLNNATIKNSYCLFGCIFSSNTNYDLYLIIQKDLIKDKTYLNNIENLNEYIVINNSVISNVNAFENSNPSSQDNFITILNWKGTLNIENSIFESIFLTPFLIKFSNEEIAIQSALNIIHSKFDQLIESSLILIEKVGGLNINSTFFLNSSFNSKRFIMLASLGKGSIYQFFQKNITTGFSIECWKVENTFLEIMDSEFSEMNSRTIILHNFLDLSIKNCTFQSVSFQDSIITFSYGGSLTIMLCYFNELSGKMSLIYGSSSDKIIFSSVYIAKCKIYSVFFLANINENLNYEMFALENDMNLLWSSDQTCKITSLKYSYFTRNIFGNFFVDFNIPNIVINFDDVAMHYNNFTSTALIRLYFGVGYLNKLNLIENFFTNSRIFLMVLNFSKGCKVFVNNSYFENNGLTTTKTYYVGFTDNCFVSMGLGVKSTIYDNLTLVASKKIEMTSGFFSGDSHGGLFQLTNSRLIFLSTNPNFTYKGIYMGEFVTAIVLNNSFYNLKCNTLTKLHMHGSVFLGCSSSYIYTKNSRSLYFNNNNFYNCSCYYGGSLAIIGLKSVEIQNCSFYNSIATNFGGHLLLVAGEISNIKNLIFNESTATFGGAIYFLNIMKLNAENILLNRAFSQKNGVIFAKLISNFVLVNVSSQNTSTFMHGGFLFLMNGFAYLSNIQISQTSASLAGGCIYTHGSSSLEITNINIIDSSGYIGGSINIENSNEVSVQNCTIDYSYSKDKGAAIFVNTVKKLQLLNFSILNNANLFGNGVAFFQTDDEEAQIILENIICRNNFAITGSCLYYFSSTPLAVNNLIIENCENISIFTSWSFHIPLKISNVVIKNIISSESLVIMSYSNLNLDNWEIYSNNIINPLISFLQVYGNISSLLFKNNSENTALDFSQANISLNGFLLQNDENFNKKMGFFRSIISDLTLKNGLVQYAHDQSTSICSFLQGNVLLSNVTFSNSKGHVLYLSFANIIVISCIFQNNTAFDNIKGNDIGFENPVGTLFNIFISGTLFEICSSYSINFAGFLNIKIENSIFVNLKQSQNESIFAINLFNFFQLEINLAMFLNFTDSSIKIFTDNLNMATSNISIKNSLFKYNEAFLGSSVYLSGTMEILFENCQFSNNIAILNNKSMDYLSGLAPAIFFKPLDLEISKITINSCKFTENIADFLAPTVFSQMHVISDNNNVFKNNFYKFPVQFTKEFFSFPIKLKLISYSYIDDDKNKLFDGENARSVQISSGKPFNLTLNLVDDRENTLYFDNSTIVLIKSTNNLDLPVSMENNLAVSKNGVLFFKDLRVKTLSNRTFELLFEGTVSKINEDIGLQLNTEQFKIYFNFSTKICQIGEIILNDSSCKKCEQSTFSLANPMSAEVSYQRCFSCPSNAYCLGGCYITPLSGYYRKNNRSLTVVPCINPKSCLGFIETKNLSDPNLIHGTCLPGSYGPVCFYCDYTYGKYQNKDSCSYCEVIIELVYVRLVLTVIFILINIIISVSSVESFSKKDADKDMFSIVSKIIINHSQYLMLIIKNSLVLPDFEIFKNFFDVFDYFSFVNIGSFLNDCFINSFLYNPQKITIYLSLYASFLPFLFAILALIFWGLIALLLHYAFKRKMVRASKNIWKALFVKYIVYLLITAYMFYPMILKSSLTLMDCFKLDYNEDVTYMRESPDIQCWDSVHIQFIVSYGLPGLLIWGISFPIVLSIILRKNYKKIHEIKEKNQIFKSFKSNKSNDSSKTQNQKQTLKKPQEISNTNKILIFSNKNSIHEHSNIQQKETSKIPESIDNTIKSIISPQKNLTNLQLQQTAKEENGNSDMLTYSYFYCGYKSKFYYWESILFFRKFTLTFILTLDQRINENYKWIFVLAILLLGLGLTYYHNPFKIKHLNRLELVSLFTCIVSCFVTALTSDGRHAGFKTLINIFSIILNLIFYFWAVLLISYDFYHKFKGRTLKIKDYFRSRLSKNKGKALKKPKPQKNVEILFEINKKPEIN